MSADKLKVLLLEDNQEDVELLKDLLREIVSTTFELKHFPRLKEALDYLKGHEDGVDVILSDLGLADSQGLDTFRNMQQQASGIPIVVLSGLADEELAIRAVREGAQDYLVKGQGDGHLINRALRYAIERCKSQERLRESQEALRRANDELEQRVRERTRELAQANLALQAEIMERERAEEELRNTSELQEVINSLLSLSVTNRTLEEIFDKTLEKLSNISGMAPELGGIVFLVDPGSKHLRLKTHRNLSVARQQFCSRVPFGDCHCGLAAATQKIQFGDSQTERHLSMPKQDPPHSHYSAPIIFEGQTMGVITVCMAAGEQRDSQKEEFLKAIANTLAGIILRRKTDKGLEQALERLKRNLYQTLESLALALEKRDPYTAGHQRRVAELAVAVARRMKLPEETVEAVELAALVHDIGKIIVPAEILAKPSKLKAMEMDLIKDHPQAGCDILKNVEFPWPINEIILQHHERLDGSGYPLGLAGENIRLEARILAVADVVEAMSSHRPYRPALGIDQALEEIRRNKGILYDAEVVEVCITYFMESDFNFLEVPSSPSNYTF
ncbi:MAG: HD domain-containing protein [Deltaproteobacteria bacterium]|nr:HD domain-containing protein [Deltaproteobacteria bacterium]